MVDACVLHSLGWVVLQCNVNCCRTWHVFKCWLDVSLFLPSCSFLPLAFHVFGGCLCDCMAGDWSFVLLICQWHFEICCRDSLLVGFPVACCFHLSFTGDASASKLCNKSSKIQLHQCHWQCLQWNARDNFWTLGTASSCSCAMRLRCRLCTAACQVGWRKRKTFVMFHAFYFDLFGHQKILQFPFDEKWFVSTWHMLFY